MKLALVNIVVLAGIMFLDATDAKAKVVRFETNPDDIVVNAVRKGGVRKSYTVVLDTANSKFTDNVSVVTNSASGTKQSKAKNRQRNTEDATKATAKNFLSKLNKKMRKRQDAQNIPPQSTNVTDSDISAVGSFASFSRKFSSQELDELANMDGIKYIQEEGLTTFQLDDINPIAPAKQQVAQINPNRHDINPFASQSGVKPDTSSKPSAADSAKDAPAPDAPSKSNSAQDSPSSKSNTSPIISSAIAAPSPSPSSAKGEDQSNKNKSSSKNAPKAPQLPPAKTAISVKGTPAPPLPISSPSPTPQPDKPKNRAMVNYDGRSKRSSFGSGSLDSSSASKREDKKAMNSKRSISGNGVKLNDDTYIVHNKRHEESYEHSQYFERISMKKRDASGSVDTGKPYMSLLQRNAPWALARLTSDKVQPNGFPVGGDYIMPLDPGKNVVFYVLDTGVNIKHSEFKNNTFFGGNYVVDDDGKKYEDDQDYNGHGTAIASLINGLTFGVAKSAKVISHKIADSGAYGDIKWIVNAIIDIIKDTTTATDNRAATIIVCSFVYPSNYAPWNDIVKEAAKAGILYVVSAGNQRNDACTKTPVMSGVSLGVGSTDVNNGYQSTTNYGKCVDVYAPGVNLAAASYLNPALSATVTGTSFAAPVVAGVAGLIASQQPGISPDKLKSTLLGYSTKDALTSTLTNSVNLLAHVPANLGES